MSGRSKVGVDYMFVAWAFSTSKLLLLGSATVAWPLVGLC